MLVWDLSPRARFLGKLFSLECLFLMCSFRTYFQIMDDQWESKVIEYGAINITGFRIVDNSRRYVREFLDNWRRLDKTTSPGAGRDSISVG